MTDAKLAERGWESEKVEPGNCVEEKWCREGSGLRAIITKSKDGDIEGVIKAVEDMATAKKRGEVILRELENLDEAADTVEKLMAVLETRPPHRETDEPPRPRIVASTD